MKILKAKNSLLKSRAARSIVCFLCLVMGTFVYLSFHLPSSSSPTTALQLPKKPKQQQEQLDSESSSRVRRRSASSSKHHRHHRLAIVIPLSGPQHGISWLPYLPAFCKSAAGVASIADVYIIHTGMPEWQISAAECPSNVFFYSVDSPRGMAERLLRVLLPPSAVVAAAVDTNHQDLGDAPSTNNQTTTDTDLLDLLTTFVQVNPYGLVEFKPALGHIFQDLLVDYSHWGYSDLDILWGDLGRWITPEELQGYDIVTYTYGDQHRLYLRGQFTFHKNDPVAINQLWRSCDYLSKLDERFREIMEKKKHYRTESAEGCYSAAVLERSDLRVKYAAGKAWTDTAEGVPNDGLIWSHGVYLTTTTSGRQVLYKPKSAGGIARRVAQLGGRQEDTYWNGEEALERPAGAMEPLKMHGQKNDGGEIQRCMYWVLPQYQTKVCLSSSDVSHDENVYWIDGELSKQKTQLTDHALTRTAALFHFQEWKRHYRFGQLASLRQSNRDVSTFLLTPNGAIPMLPSTSSLGEGTSKKKTKSIERPPSPLGIPMQQWNGLQNDRTRFPLPTNLYCLHFELDRTSKKKLRCTDTVSWQDTETVRLLSTASGWKNVHVEEDVTLVLTLQISASQSSSTAALKAVIGHLLDNLERWLGQPIVAVLSMAGATKESMDYLVKHLGPTSVFSERNRHAFIAAICDETPDAVMSRKALLNMATDMVPTRWYVSGLELERGLVLSQEANFWATQMASTYQKHRGNVFWIPQFGLGSEDTSSHYLIDKKHISAAKENGQIQFLSEADAECDGESSIGGRIIPKPPRLFNPLDTMWWELTESSLEAEVERQGALISQIGTLQDFEGSIMDLLAGVVKDQKEGREDNKLDMLAGQDESPILLIDNLVHPGVHAHEMVRQVEELEGLACYNAFMLSQLVTLGYQINVLPHVFALSTAASQKASSSEACRGCLGAEDNSVRSAMERVVNEERSRASETAIVWAESLQDPVQQQ